MEAHRKPALSETPAIEGRDTVKNVQALRGIAALLVMWVHVKFPVERVVPEAGNYALIAWGNGAMGVDLFFAISGFVISLAACKRHYRPLEFLLARFARVSPLNYCFIGIFLIAKAVITHRFNDFSSLWNGLCYLPLFDWKIMSWPPGGLGWTLCFEMWFYTVFALMLNFFTARKAGLFLALIFIVGAPLATLDRGDWWFPHFMFHPFTLDFAAGCAIFQVQRFISIRMAWCLIVAALIYLAVFALATSDMANPILSTDGIAYGWFRVLMWGLPSACLLAGMVGLERNKSWVSPAWLVWFGTISYSLYLSQGVTLPAFFFVARHVGLHQLPVMLILEPASCIGVAWLCWKGIERPLTQRAQRLVRRIYHGT
jgi:exopolysaccharide production protein ExoZ